MIINEVDSHTNLEDLKNEYEKTQFVLERIRAEKDKFYNELSAVTINLHELEYKH